MGKRGGRSQRKGERIPKNSKKNQVVEENMDDMDDEIDAFHKQRDLIPLNVNDASDDSDDDEEMPVFDLKGMDESDEDEEEHEIRDTGDAAKMARQQKYMKEKFGTRDDATIDGDDEEEGKTVTWSGSKHQFYNDDNEINSSDDEARAEHEAEVIRLQKEKANSMSLADFGAEDTSEDESDEELTLEEISVKGKSTKKSKSKKDEASEIGTTFEAVKKDLSGLSREELMDVLYSSAPELLGLLSELNHAVEELETKIDPFLNKVKSGEIKLEGGIRYLELKKLLLLSYSQAIAFYLLLKSEGQAARDHPVLDRIVEIKSLLNKTKELDVHIPAGFEELLKRSKAVNLGLQIVTPEPDSINDDEPSPITTEIPAKVVPNIDRVDVKKVESLKENGKKAEKRKRQEDQVSAQSMKMLKVRAALEEKLRQKGVFGSVAPKVDKSKKQGKILNSRLETYDDFDDDAVIAKTHTGGLDSGPKSSLSSSKISQLVANNSNKSKGVSGDDDLPVRDDIGERRRKHELRVLARAGISPEEGADVFETEDKDEDEAEDEDEDEDSGSGLEYYNQVKQQRDTKMAAKANMYSRETAMPSEPEIVDGKRLITYQMEKNRGLTRQRKKEIKNPRKKYKLKHEKAVKRRAGQVRQVRKPMGPYGGEASGINANISRSIRFRN